MRRETRAKMKEYAKEAAAEMDDLSRRLSAALDGKNHDSDLMEANEIWEELRIEGDSVSERQQLFGMRLRTFMETCRCPACEANRREAAGEDGAVAPRLN